MTTLKDMGIQQWRLRPPAIDIHEPAKAQENSNDLIAPKIILDAKADSHELSNAVEPNKRIWPTQQNESSNDKVTQITAKPTESGDSGPLDKPIESKSNSTKSIPALTPVPAPISASDKEQDQQRPQLKVMPMPAPMPVPSSLESVIEPSSEAFIDVPPASEPFIDNEQLIDEPQMLSNNGLNNSGWRDLQSLVDGWQHCPTCGEGKSLLGHGNVNADWLFVSDAPSRPEIEQGQLYSGREGQLFDAILSALDLNRQVIYSTSLFKCMASEDMSVIPTCDDILQRQIELIQPKVIISLGEFVSQTLLKSNDSLETLRAQQQVCIHSKVPVVPSYSPVQLLDGASLKPKVWDDLKRAIAIANLTR